MSACYLSLSVNCHGRPLTRVVRALAGSGPWWLTCPAMSAVTLMAATSSSLQPLLWVGLARTFFPAYVVTAMQGGVQGRERSSSDATHSLASRPGVVAQACCAVARRFQPVHLFLSVRPSAQDQRWRPCIGQSNIYTGRL